MQLIVTEKNIVGLFKKVLVKFFIINSAKMLNYFLLETLSALSFYLFAFTCWRKVIIFKKQSLHSVLIIIHCKIKWQKIILLSPWENCCSYTEMIFVGVYAVFQHPWLSIFIYVNFFRKSKLIIIFPLTISHLSAIRSRPFVNPQRSSSTPLSWQKLNLFPSTSLASCLPQMIKIECTHNKNFRVPVGWRIQLLRFFAIGNRYNKLSFPQASSVKKSMLLNKFTSCNLRKINLLTIAQTLNSWIFSVTWPLKFFCPALQGDGWAPYIYHISGPLLLPWQLQPPYIW